MHSVPAKPTNPMANKVKTIVAKLIYGAVPINVNSISEVVSKKSCPFIATEIITVSLYIESGDSSVGGVVHLIVVEFIKTAVDSPNLPNLHFIADNPPEDNYWGWSSYSSIKLVESTGDTGIGSKNSESSAADM